jgi:hypothetical protein
MGVEPLHAKENRPFERAVSGRAIASMDKKVKHFATCV